MKKKDKYTLISHALREYSKIFGHGYKRVYLSPAVFENLLKQYAHSTMCIWSYCCYGLYQNCWQDPYEEGIWNMTQEEVNSMIMDKIHEYAKACRRDMRIGYYEDDYGIHVVIVARDLYSQDFLFTFTNREN